MVRESFISCAVTCATDGSQDDEITCIKKDQPCSAGREMLKEQLNYMNTIESNPFIAEECDVMEACPNELVIEEDEDDDEDIVID